MSEQMGKQEETITEKIKNQYDGLVRNLFTSTFDLKVKYDEFG